MKFRHHLPAMLFLLCVPLLCYSQTNWSDPATWGGTLPRAGDTVTIAEGQTVILDTETPDLTGVIINGTLKAENDTDFSLTTGWVLVSGPGSLLSVGTEDELYRGQGRITLTGTVEEGSLFGEGSHKTGQKFIAVQMGGTLELHGSSSRKTSWSQLSESVQAGASVISLAGAKDFGWNVGDTLVIAPSGFEPLETEVRTITAISGDTVSLDSPLQYPHFGEMQEFGGKILDERAEVANITRNIVIEGAEDSLMSDFGGHTIIMPGGTAHVEGVEFFRMGQKGHPARYPFHWHHVNRHGNSKGEGQYIRNSVVHNSFQRAIVVHGTSGALVESNVAYNISNHAFVPSEDGDEINNQFIANLAILNHSPEFEDFAFPINRDFKSLAMRSGQSEFRSSSFWLRNPMNILIGNHAVGAINGNGFFFDLRFIDRTLTTNIKEITSANIFVDNVAHSIQFIGASGKSGKEYPEATMGHGVFSENLSNFPKYFDRFTGYKNFGGAWIHGRTNIMRDSIVADCGTEAFMMRGRIEDSVLVGQSNNTQGTKPTSKFGVFGAIHLVTDHDGERSPSWKNVSIFNKENGPGILYTRQPIGFGSSSGEVRFVNTPWHFWLKPHHNTGAYEFKQRALLDLDGTLSGTNQPGILARTLHGAIGEDDLVIGEWNAGFVPLTQVVEIVSDGSFDKAISSSGKVVHLTKINYSDISLPDSQFNNFINTSYEYVLRWKSLDPVNTSLLIKRGAGKVVRLAVKLNGLPAQILFDGQQLAEFGSKQELDLSSSSAFTFNSSNGWLHLKIIPKSNDTVLFFENAIPAESKGLVKLRQAATNVVSPTPQLRYAYYALSEGQGLEDLKSLTPNSTGLTPDLKAPAFVNTDKPYAITYSGYLNIPIDATYYFSASGKYLDFDMRIDNLPLITRRYGPRYFADWDWRGNFIFNNTSTTLAEVQLQKGLHPFTFSVTNAEPRYANGFSVSFTTSAGDYTTPFHKHVKSNPFTKISADMLFHGQNMINVAHSRYLYPRELKEMFGGILEPNPTPIASPTPAGLVPTPEPTPTVATLPPSEYLEIDALHLVNTETGEVVANISNNIIVDLKDVGESLSIIAHFENNSNVKSVDFNLKGALVRQQTENVFPYALGGNEQGVVTDVPFLPGDYFLEVIPYSNDGTEGTPLMVGFTIVDTEDSGCVMKRASARKQRRKVRNLFRLQKRTTKLIRKLTGRKSKIGHRFFERMAESSKSKRKLVKRLKKLRKKLSKMHRQLSETSSWCVAPLRLSLVDTKTNTIVQGFENMNDNVKINLQQLSLEEFSVQAFSNNSNTQSVKFVLDGAGLTRTENIEPYALFGDRNGEFLSRPLLPGEYQLSVMAFSKKRAKGDLLESRLVNIVIEDKAEAPTPAPTPQPTATATPTASVSIPEEALRISTSQQLEEAIAGSQAGQTFALEAGVYELQKPLKLKEGTHIIGVDTEQVVLQPAPEWTSSFDNLPNQEDSDEYLFSLIKQKNIKIQQLTLRGATIHGGIFVDDADGLEVSHCKFGEFGWSGIRGYRQNNTRIFKNTFLNSGTKRGNRTPGSIYLDFTRDSEFFDNQITRSSDHVTGLYGIKGEGLHRSRIHHNTINTNFAIEIPFRNDEGNEIDHNILNGVVSIPKYAGGLVDPVGGSFHIHHNYFTRTYSIELARNGLTIENNLFDFKIEDDKGNLMSNFGSVHVPGPLTFKNNRVQNPARGILWSSGSHDNIRIENNHIRSNTTLRDNGFLGMNSNSDFSTVYIRNNIFENTSDNPRPLLRNDESGFAVIENNLLTNITDLSRYINPSRNAPQGFQGDDIYEVGALGRFQVRGWTLEEKQ